MKTFLANSPIFIPCDSHLIFLPVCLEHTPRDEPILQARLAELEDLSRLLEASDTRSEGFLNRIEEMDQQMAALAQERDKWRNAASQPQPASRVRQPGGLLNAEQRAKFVQILKGSPTSSLTLITLAGSDTSRKLGNHLASMIAAAGWNVEVVETPVESPPPSHTFVVQSQATTPETALSLSVALAIVEVMSFPPKVMFNPERPPGFLGLILVPPQS